MTNPSTNIWSPERLLELLAQEGIPYEIEHHDAVFNMSESHALHLKHAEDDAKNLFVRDDKKTHYWLFSVRVDQRLDLKAFRQSQQTRALKFATADELQAYLGLTPGSVSPMGLMNDSTGTVTWCVDASFLEGTTHIGVHPNVNTATVWLATKDLMDLLEKYGHRVRVLSKKKKKDTLRGGFKNT